MNYYECRKEKIRNEAISWQTNFKQNNYSYEELLDYQSYFEMVGRKYGLLKEFRENGVC